MRRAFLHLATFDAKSASLSPTGEAGTPPKLFTTALHIVALEDPARGHAVYIRVFGCVWCSCRCFCRARWAEPRPGGPSKSSESLPPDDSVVVSNKHVNNFLSRLQPSPVLSSHGPHSASSAALAATSSSTNVRISSTGNARRLSVVALLTLQVQRQTKASLTR